MSDDFADYQDNVIGGMRKQLATKDAEIASLRSNLNRICTLKDRYRILIRDHAREKKRLEAAYVDMVFNATGSDDEAQAALTKIREGQA